MPENSSSTVSQKARRNRRGHVAQENLLKSMYNKSNPSSLSAGHEPKRHSRPKPRKDKNHANCTAKTDPIAQRLLLMKELPQIDFQVRKQRVVRPKHDPRESCMDHYHPRRHRRPRPKKSAFLNLPAEIRNLIYSYVFPPARILIRGNEPNKELSELQQLWENRGKFVKRPRYRLNHLLDNIDIDEGVEISSALLLVCRNVKQEVELFVYSQMTFCFDSTQVLGKFLNVVPQQGIKEIRKLELYHSGYGTLSSAHNAAYKHKHDRSWQSTCERIGKELEALSSLKLDFRIVDWPVTWTEKDQWWQTLMLLIPRGPLDHVKVSLEDNKLKKHELWEVSRTLEDRMMNEHGQKMRDEREAIAAIAKFEQRQLQRRARLAVLPPVQASKVLNIKLDSQTVRSPYKTQPSKLYYNTRTRDWARLGDNENREGYW